MAELEDDLKVQNWLSVSTFDLFKFVAAGGELVIEEGEGGLVLTMPGIFLSSKGVNKKFAKLAAAVVENK